ncbi:MAG: peptidase M28 [Acidobacteria bacterium]|nr:MAG: peptidase M28 [Acidobacteriota bacterium]
MKTTKSSFIALACFASLSLVLLAFLGIASPQTQQAVPGGVATGFNTIREDTLRADLTFLASDALQGRMSLQTGDEVAIQWIASEFAKAGLKPVANGSFLQPVELIEYRGDRENSYVALQRGGSQSVWRFPDAFGAYRADVHVTANVVFAGFGITAPELHYDDYQGIDAHGKIVLIFDHEPQETDPASVFNGTGNTRYATGRVKVLNAQAHGAVGVLIVAEPNRKHPSNQERVARIGGSITRAVPLPSQALAEDDLHTPAAIISDAAGKEILATAGADPSQLQAAIDRDLKPQSRALPDTQVTLHYRNVSLSSGKTYNVAGLLEGSDPKLKAETILFSGHHDHDGISGEQIWHGADDNGSGTVGVVALAHAYATNAAHGERPKRSLLFVVFAAEERGLLGSFFMATHPLRPLETTRAVINFDMIGRNETESDQTKGLLEIPANTTNRLNLIGASYSPDYNRTLVAENKYVGLDLDYRFDRDYALNIFFRSDQFPFVLHNIPSFWWFTGFHPDYHHTTDTADKINYGKMAKILRLAYLTGFQFANEAAPPRFIANPGGRAANQGD